MRKRIAVVLAGCGVRDGSEIHEAALTLLYLNKMGAAVTCAAPDIKQSKVVNHANGSQSAETRSVLAESARIARGEIERLAALNERDFDGVAIPGGFGAALNLCDFAVKGAGGSVNPDLLKFLKAMRAAGKPIAAMCIAPVILALAFGSDGVRLTVGNDASTAAELQKTGAKHVVCKVDEICFDEKNKLITTPAYMLGPGIAEVSAGIEKLCAKLVETA
jgi:enhancing lycopene biosynthesis protein 2